MTNNYDIRFTGTLVARTPISIVPPNVNEVALGGGSYLEVARQVVVNADTGAVERVPVIPASTIRGKLRRAAAKVGLSHFEERPKLKPWLYSTIGDIKGAEKEDTYTIHERNERRERNPIVALFGASVPWDASRAMVEHAISTTKDTSVITAVRSDDFQRNADVLDLIDGASLGDYLEKRENVKALKDAKGTFSDTLRKYLAAKESGRTAEANSLKAELDSARGTMDQAKKAAGNSMMMPHAHEAIPIGTRFNHRIVLRRVTQAEAGLFLAAIDYAFSQEPNFGGKGDAMGYGQVDAQWNVEVREAGKVGAAWVPAGSISVTPLGDAVLTGELPGYLKAWEAYAKSGKMNLLVDGANGADASDEGGSENTKGKKTASKKAKA